MNNVVLACLLLTKNLGKVCCYTLRGATGNRYKNLLICKHYIISHRKVIFLTVPGNESDLTCHAARYPVIPSVTLSFRARRGILARFLVAGAPRKLTHYPAARISEFPLYFLPGFRRNSPANLQTGIHLYWSGVKYSAGMETCIPPIFYPENRHDKRTEPQQRSHEKTRHDLERETRGKKSQERYQGHIPYI